MFRFKVLDYPLAHASHSQVSFGFSLQFLYSIFVHPIGSFQNLEPILKLLELPLRFLEFFFCALNLLDFLLELLVQPIDFHLQGFHVPFRVLPTAKCHIICFYNVLGELYYLTLKLLNFLFACQNLFFRILKLFLLRFFLVIS